MIDREQLSIYEVRTTIRSVYDVLEILAYIKPDQITDEHIQMIKRSKDDLLELIKHHWTISIL